MTDTPRPEAQAAADWWTDKLTSKPKHSVDGGRIDAFAAALQVDAGPSRSDEQIEDFRRALADAIEDHISCYPWDPDDPERGNSMRYVRTDYGPDELLAAAAEAAGMTVNILTWPLKAVMWINPGRVIVAEGVGAEWVDIYPDRQ